MSQIDLPEMNQKSTEPIRPRVQAAIHSALDFLQRNQLPYGEFRTYAARDKRLTVDCRFDSSPFVTAWVVDSIQDCQDSRVSRMTKRALKFLLKEMEGPGVWRYWSSRNENHAFLPPDLDDTCCISFVLGKLGQTAPVNREIVLANRDAQGIFYTWMVPRPESPGFFAEALGPLIDTAARLVWSSKGILENIDPAVCANVLLYLGECAETQATLAYVIEAVYQDRNSRSLSFYPDPLTLYYLVSRAFRHGVRALAETRTLIGERVLAAQKRNGSLGNSFLTALGICTLLNLDYPAPEIASAVEYLLDQQTRSGAWQKAAAFLGPAPYYGSEELTTALCAQVLARFCEGID